MAYQTIPATPEIPVPGSFSVSALEAIASPRILGLRTGGPATPQALTPVDAATTIYTRGANLGDTNVTIQPFVDMAGYYVMPAGTMTNNRTITIGNTNISTFFANGGAVAILRIIRLDRTAFTLTLQRADLALILSDLGSPPIEREFSLVCSPAGNWAPSSIFPVRV